MDDREDLGDRNGEPCEDSLGCLVMLVCLAGILLITWAVAIGLVAGAGR